MSDRTKYILMVIGFIASVILIAYGLYYAFFRGSPLPVIDETTPVTEDQSGGLSLSPLGDGYVTEETITETPDGLSRADDVAIGGLTQSRELTTAPIFSPTLASDGKSLNFYDESDNKFYRIDRDGNVEALSDKQFPSVEKATWDNTAGKAILEFPDGSNIVYDFENETQVTLPKHWEDFDFSPVSDQLIAKSIGLDPENRWIVISNANGSNVKSIQELGENESKVQVNWAPNDQVVAFSDTAEGLGSFDRKTIIPLGKDKENFKGLVVEGLNFSSKWSLDGKKLLYSVAGAYSNYKPLLWIVSATSSTMGENRKSLALNTWVEKCTWSSVSTVYCAVPRNLPSNAGLQPLGYATLPDDLYKLDVASGTSSLIAVPDGGQTMKDLFVTSDESLLYYKNAGTGNLESIKLK